MDLAEICLFTDAQYAHAHAHVFFSRQKEILLKKLDKFT